ncbi:MAG: hypothetical protein RL329_265 [Bacteroidota bacterium]
MSCFQKSSYEHIQIGMSFDAFQKKGSPKHPLVKDIFSARDNAYGCRLNGAEYLFMNNELLSVKIDTLHLFFNESKQVFNHLTLDKTIQQWAKHGLNWEIYRLYTLEKQIVLLCNDIIYEFIFMGNKFKLDQIRIRILDPIKDNAYLINHIESENKKLKDETI